jgi:hypothetical protein
VQRARSAEWRGDVFGEVDDVIAAGEEPCLKNRSQIAASIEADGEPVLDAVGVGVDGRSGEIGRIVKLGGRVAGGKRGITARAFRKTERAT